MRWAGLLVVGCAGASGVPTGETGRSTVALADDGRACLFGGAPSDEPDTSFADGGAVTARVVLEGCASGCAEDVQASCEVRLVQTEVAITATGSYTLPLGSPACDDVCVAVVAECAGEPLSAGTWTLHYGGGHSDPLTVPGTGPVPCVEPLLRRW